jgi:hypothetical protein
MKLGIWIYRELVGNTYALGASSLRELHDRIDRMLNNSVNIQLSVYAIQVQCKLVQSKNTCCRRLVTITKYMRTSKTR